MKLKSKGIIRVAKIAIESINEHERNLPKSSEKLDVPDVSNNSIVPLLFSSVHIFIVIALDKKIRSKGSDSNNGRMSIIFLEKNLSTQKKLKITTPRKAPKKTREEDEEKNK